MSDMSAEQGASSLVHRPWVPAHSEALVQTVAAETAAESTASIASEIGRLIDENRVIHEERCINLNPAANVMSPAAERVLSARLGGRPSLGYPGDKYEMGLEAVERIEIIAAELAAEVFGSSYAEIRVPSGAIANLYAFMATAKAGDLIIAPPPEIGGHVTHHGGGAAGLFGLITHPAPIDAVGYTVDVDALRRDAHALKPKLITIGGSLNLFPHPIAEIRAIADEVGAYVLFDAAHMCGMIAGHAWQQPLAEGAHMITMSTYKSLGGPPSGLIVTNDAVLAERLDKIAYPGLTANFDVSKSAALALTLLDWKAHGRDYAAMMRATAIALGKGLHDLGIPVFGADLGVTRSHQLAIEAARYGGGHAAAKRLAQANILTSGIGLPLPPVAGDANGIRLGTAEAARWGFTPQDMIPVASFIADVLEQRRLVEDVAVDVTRLRAQRTAIRFVRDHGDSVRDLGE